MNRPQLFNKSLVKLSIVPLKIHNKLLQLSNTNQDIHEYEAWTLKWAFLFMWLSTASCSILSLIELHCIKPNNCVKTIYKLKKFFLYINTPLIRHFYCSTCFSKLDNQFCNMCRSNDNATYLIEVPILDQLASFYKRSKFRENLINQNFELRSTDESILFAENVQNTNTNVFGLKGPMILSKIVHDYVNSTAIDIMHCVYQGITKKLLSFWFETDNRTQAYSLLAFINVVDEKLRNLLCHIFFREFPE
ncbi:hypothetical protein TSAR_006517 [Trichomalopsis sarcophagae]|uniref:Uncharacterized protein n=1 Tax=Trichomalopsis sarcophagae TaxID=543379 RepID=A0A232EH53_9HYME|nr:hypothetical protein TSAR_006517 [Trichomalopsis sarcophagae]